LRYSWGALAFVLVGGWSVVGSSDARSPAPRSQVALGAGKVAGFRWGAYAFSQGGPMAERRPCLRIQLSPRRDVTVDPTQISLDSVECRSLEEVPNILAVVNELEATAVTAVVMGFRSNARDVSIYFAGPTGDRKVALARLSPEKARKTGLAPFRYTALAFAGNSCISRFVVHDKSGKVIEDGGRMRCQASSPA
jgi:hypothetical protein